MREAGEAAPAATDLLRRSGFPGSTARLAGVNGEVLMIASPPDEAERLAGESGGGVLAGLRELGVRYIALDLAPEAGPT